MELAGIEVIKRLVALGFGVSIVPSISVQAEVDAGVLKTHRVLPRSQHCWLGVITALGERRGRGGRFDDI